MDRDNDRREIRNVCIYGVGGVGGYFGGKIVHEAGRQTEEGVRVFFVGRGEHLEEIKKTGLILNTSEKKGMICKPFFAAGDMEDIPEPDLCLVCVKSYDLTAAAESLKGKIRDDTYLIPLLNGIDIYERVRAVLKNGIVLPACAYVGTHIERPGMVTQQGAEGIILCGKDMSVSGFDPAPLIRFFKNMGINFTWVDDPFPAIWEKYVFIAAFGLVTAWSGKTIGGVVSDDALKELLKRIMTEIVSIAAKKGITLPENIVTLSVEKANRFPFETKTSYQRDIEAKGKKNEGNLFGSTIIRMGETIGVTTPATRSIWSEIEGKLP